MKKSPSLILVPTPIGNRGDITLRALEILRTVGTILAEDTRKSGLLLKHYGIKASLQSFHIFNEHKETDKIISRMSAGENFALITDAGTPSISDPGFLLVRACLAAKLEIECLPGPTALIPALVKSGFPSDRFVFEGFLPHKKGKQTLLKQIAEEEKTTIIYESPNRLLKTLTQMEEHFGETRQISVSRELTKIYEETITAPLCEVIEYFSQHKIKGEVIIVVHGK